VRDGDGEGPGASQDGQDTDHLPPRRLPLADLRILAIEQYGAGPFGSIQLAELGAEVIKIEDPRSGGDIGRFIPPHDGTGDSLFFETFNHNKRSIALDLAHPDGRRAFERLVARSDVVYSNLRGDVPAKLGIRYQDLRRVNPLIVCGSLTGFGTSGTHATEPGYDYILQGLAGWMWLTGEPGAPPTKAGLSLVDFASGYAAAASILAAVHAARRDGEGMDCDVALYDVAMSLLTYVATWQLSSGFTTERIPSSGHPTLIPFQNFATADGWIVVACAKEKFWRRLVEEIGVPELADDPRFADFANRAANREELIPILEKCFLQETTAEWLVRLAAAGVPVGPAHDLPSALADPRVAERGLVLGYEHDGLGPVRVIRAAVSAGSRRPDVQPAPRLGADTREVLRRVGGLTDTEIDALAAAGGAALGPVVAETPSSRPGA
jgi:crotonobetainyl-CoA:carnitine CoA-transferase CaiB-like acyl-CoA transferase